MTQTWAHFSILSVMCSVERICQGEECDAKGLNRGRSLAMIRVRGGCLGGL